LLFLPQRTLNTGISGRLGSAIALPARMSGLEREHRSLKKSARRLKMTVHKVEEVVPTGEEIGLKLLQSVREMKARTFARTTEIDVNDVVQARHGTGLSQSEFASALNISKRTLQECRAIGDCRAIGEQ
jgi:DNA-binding transcriptional regulator YiaG